MAHVGSHIAKFDEQIAALDLEIKACIREQAYAGEATREELRKINLESAELVEKIESVKAKAQVSEEMVKSICSDIRSLDFAKRNITFTITSLKRMIMLSKSEALDGYSHWSGATEGLLHRQTVQRSRELD